MDRRKAELKFTSDRLKLECESVVELLNKIIEKNTRYVAFIESLNGKQLLANARHFLDITQFQHDALQKVLGIGLELEVFVDGVEIADKNEVSSETYVPLAITTQVKAHSALSSNANLTETAHSINTAVEAVTVIDVNKHCDGVMEKGDAVEAKNKSSNEITAESTEIIDMEVGQKGDNVDVEVVSRDDTILSADAKGENDAQNEEDENVPEQDSCKFTEGMDCIDVVNNKNESEFLHDVVEVENTEILLTKSDSSDYPDETDKETNKKTSSDVTSAEEGGDDPIKNVPTECISAACVENLVNVDVSKAPEQPTNFIQQKLKAKKLLSRKDRYLQSLPKLSMPDLAFKPSSRVVEVSDSFVSCVDSSDSSCSKTSKDEKKKEKCSESIVGREEEIKTLKFPHLRLAESPTPFVGMSCLISYAKNPSEIYINVADENIALIDSMALQIAELYQNSSCPFDSKDDAFEKLGNYSVVYIEEFGLWYRAEIIRWHLKGKSYLADQVTVQLVDYGHVVNVSYKYLRQLIVDFCHIPKCAIKCHLAALYPPGSTMDSLLEYWPEESMTVFNDVLHNVSDAVYTLMYAEDMQYSWAIDLIDSQADDVSIGQQLINAGVTIELIQDPVQAVKHNFCMNQVQTAQGMSGILTSMADEQKLEVFFKNNSLEVADNLDEAMVCYKANDEARICRFTRPDGTCFKGVRCKLDHEQLRPDGVTTDKKFTHKSAFNELHLPQAGENVFLQVTNVLTINSFYACQVEKMANSTYSTGLLRLLKLMNSEETASKYQTLNLVPDRGEIVIVKSWNGNWYRGQVHEVFRLPDKNEQVIQVFIVDFGELIDVTISDLRQIVPDYLHLPFQAILCRLYNVKPLNNQNETETKEYFESHFLCQCFSAEVKYSSNSCIEVLLNNCSGEDVGQQIIDDGYGEEQTEHFFPKDSETLLVD